MGLRVWELKASGLGRKAEDFRFRGFEGLRV